MLAARTPPGQKPPRPEDLEALTKMVHGQNDPLALAAAARRIEDFQTSEAKIRANKVPTLALVGELDPTKKYVDKLAGLMPNLKVVVIPGANHWSAFGNPEFLRSLKAFLAEHSGK